MDFGTEEEQALQAVIGGLDHDQMDFRKLEELLNMQANDLASDPDLLDLGGFGDANDAQAPPVLSEDLNSLNEAKDLVAYVSGGSVLSPPESNEDPYSPNAFVQSGARAPTTSQQAPTPQQQFWPNPHVLAVLQQQYPGVPLEKLVQGLQSGALLQRGGPGLANSTASMTPPHQNSTPSPPSIVDQQKSPARMPMFDVEDQSQIGRFAKKRKYDDSSFDASDLQLDVESAAIPMTTTTVPPPPASDLSYQSLKWQAHCPQEWAPLFDAQLKPMVLDFQVAADKGFNFSTVDDAFVCQKKNHFQITCMFALPGMAQYVQTQMGPKAIESFRVHIHGMKLESHSSVIKVEQSQPDRSKKRYDPATIQFDDSRRRGKVTVGRLHFSETTSNNMRKKGKPNPDQRYFSLVVSLRVHTTTGQQCIVSANNSERIIVRASNPGQFENDTEASWKPGQHPDSIHFSGRVGINTERPDEALTVLGNVRVTGKIRAPSDLRAKEVMGQVDSKQQLKNVAGLPIYQYRFKDDVAEYLGLPESDRDQVGVLAQELRGVLPDAVKETEDIDLPSGEKIEKFLVVDKDRLYMENVGAVKELCKLTDALEDRIGHLEKIQKKLKRNSSRTGSLALSMASSPKEKKSMTATSGGSDTSSELSSLSTTPSSTIGKKAGRKMSRDLEKQRAANLFRQSPLCTPRFMQGLILLLIVIMSASAISMAILFAMSNGDDSSPVVGDNSTQSSMPMKPKSSFSTTNDTNGTATFRDESNSTAIVPLTQGTTTSEPPRRLATNPVVIGVATTEARTTKKSETPTTSAFCCSNPNWPLNSTNGGVSGGDPESSQLEESQPLVPPITNVLLGGAGNDTRIDPFCRTCKGNVTYFVDVPGNLASADATLTLSSSSKVNLYLCSNSSQDWCPSENSPTASSSQPMLNINQTSDMEFVLTLPLLQHQLSNFSLRAVAENKVGNCSSSLSDAGKTYTLYVFNFARVCGLTQVTSHTSS